MFMCQVVAVVLVLLLFQLFLFLLLFYGKDVKHICHVKVDTLHLARVIFYFYFRLLVRYSLPDPGARLQDSGHGQCQCSTTTAEIGEH